MKKLFLTFISVFTILYSQAQCQAYFGLGQNGVIISFTDSSTMQSTNYSATWSWDFGDGNTSNQQNPVHTYSNGMYNACLIITFLDSVSMNTCISTYCDSIFIGNAPPASWDCTPANGCFDPGTGLGQYSTLTACQTACGIPSWDCDPVTGCYDPGTGAGLYTTLSTCLAVCGSTTSNYCDSMTVTGSQYVFTVEVNNINTIIDHWLTTSNNYADTLQYDNMTNIHTINTVGVTYDTIITCITYANVASWYTCCVTWVWNGSYWAKIGSVTSIGEINLSNNKKLLKVIDVLGRNANGDKNKPLFYIYDDGTVEKKIILE